MRNGSVVAAREVQRKQHNRTEQTLALDEIICVAYVKIYFVSLDTRQVIYIYLQLWILNHRFSWVGGKFLQLRCLQKKIEMRQVYRSHNYSVLELSCDHLLSTHAETLTQLISLCQNQCLQLSSNLQSKNLLTSNHTEPFPKLQTCFRLKRHDPRSVTWLSMRFLFSIALIANALSYKQDIYITQPLKSCQIRVTTEHFSFLVATNPNIGNLSTLLLQKIIRLYTFRLLQTSEGKNKRKAKVRIFVKLPYFHIDISKNGVVFINFTQVLPYAQSFDFPRCFSNLALKHQNKLINSAYWKSILFLFEIESIQVHFAVQFNSFPQQLQQLIWRMGEAQCKRKNARISTKRREQLINDVVKKGQPVFRVAQRLRIKPSTARLIVMKYNQTGTFYHRKMIEDIRKERQKTEKKQSQLEEFYSQEKIQAKEENKATQQPQYYPFLQFFNPVYLDAHLPFDLGSVPSFPA